MVTHIYFFRIFKGRASFKRSQNNVHSEPSEHNKALQPFRRRYQYLFNSGIRDRRSNVSINVETTGKAFLRKKSCLIHFIAHSGLIKVSWHWNYSP